MLNYNKYKILKFINKCPDLGIPKIVIHNALNIDNNELETILKTLFDKELIIILNDKYKNVNPNYSVSTKGSYFIKKYPISIFKSLWDKYLFPIILSLFFFILGFILGK